ncbi:hypothetical protein WJX81_003262 [Elliptochloris bilobata]|uniref:Rieske-like [2Fe-2S] domain-containing protein n=1 Tax=Elliptochloris bilobata TaxID=381761 RepID=A0AAW1SCZ7_9CHLO
MSTASCAPATAVTQRRVTPFLAGFRRGWSIECEARQLRRTGLAWHQPQRPQRLACRAKKGFGSGSAKSKKRSASRLSDDDPDWIKVATLSDFPAGGRPTLPVILKDKSAIVLYRVDDDVYCSDANSTAFKFPLVDAKLLERNGGPAVEVPLDGTVYDLDTGRVLEWCPKNNPIRLLLGSLKSKSEPEPLKVYPTRISEDGTIYARFAPLS